MDQDNRNLPELENKYEKILEDNPQSNSFILLAEILIKRKKIEKAIRVLNNGLKYNPSNTTAMFLLGKIYYENWMIDQAKKQFERVLSVSPDNLGSVNYLVQIYRSEDDLEKALEISRKSLFYFPGNTDIMDMVGSIEKEIEVKELTMENTIQSEKPEKHLSESESAGGMVSETLADIYLEQGYYRECIDIYEKLQRQTGDPMIEEKKKKAIKLLFMSRES